VVSLACRSTASASGPVLVATAAGVKSAGEIVLRFHPGTTLGNDHNPTVSGIEVLTR
jgi:hypothetical protein